MRRKQFFLVSFICFSHKLHNHRYLNTEEIHSIQKKQNLKKNKLIVRLLDRILHRISFFFCLLESVHIRIFKKKQEKGESLLK